MILGRDGNFYGTTASGSNGFGSVFRISTNGTVTTLASFDIPSGSGIDPRCTLVMDTNGNLFGTAPQSGAGLRGTVFRIATNGVLTALASFNGTNGSSPNDGLVIADDGNFYGTAAGGGANNVGTIFRMTPA